ncbi:carboxylic ester hydrolase-like [Cylas formicarius]|uniref:carboxylic ester hydrolase-like n=1 Tax=Cylas formicarius TaxID=197179 RepID=UPI002958B73D|nr:carboxylic ester hydrolase-like [Cylas formicarius]
MVLFIILVIAVTSDGILCQVGRPVVTTRQGDVRGVTNTTQLRNRTYHAFRGIPYAQPPIGDLRFRAPRKARPWVKPLDAAEDKSECTQSDGAAVVGSEDCLYINVYTPQINANLPVMVWIYGGSFKSGMANFSIYNPENFLEENVVFVSFNYRVGIFGFLSTGDLESPGNWGLKDQVLALKWVKENIRGFGGNPNKVTIFGQSAGSGSVSYLVQSEKARGLFHGGIMESGTTLSSLALSRNSKTDAFHVGIRYGLNTTSTRTLVRELRKVDYSVLQQISDQVVALNFIIKPTEWNVTTFGVVDEPYHEEAFFSGRSRELLICGDFYRVPVIVGYTSNELGFITYIFDQLKPLLPQYEADPSKLAPPALTRDRVEKLLAGYLIDVHYFGRGGIFNSTPQSVSNFLSEELFNRPGRETVNLMSKYTDVYFYVFSYAGGVPRKYPGAAHADELQYLFRNNANASRADQLTRDRLLKLWTNFAKFQNPTPRNDEPLFRNVTWLTAKHGLHRDKDDVNYLNIGDELVLAKNPSQSDWLFYRDLYRRFGEGIDTTY